MWWMARGRSGYGCGPYRQTCVSNCLGVAPIWREGFGIHDKNGDARIDRAGFENGVRDAFYIWDQGREGNFVLADLPG